MGRPSDQGFDKRNDHTYLPLHASEMARSMKCAKPRLSRLQSEAGKHPQGSLVALEPLQRPNIGLTLAAELTSLGGGLPVDCLRV